MYYASNHMFVMIRCSLHDIGKMIKIVQYLPNLFFVLVVLICLAVIKTGHG